MRKWRRARVSFGMLWVNAAHGLNVARWDGAARRLGTSRPRSRCHSTLKPDPRNLEPLVAMLRK